MKSPRTQMHVNSSPLQIVFHSYIRVVLQLIDKSRDETSRMMLSTWREILTAAGVFALSERIVQNMWYSKNIDKLQW
jgi:hypothetical protein